MRFIVLFQWTHCKTPFLSARVKPVKLGVEIGRDGEGRGGSNVTFGRIYGLTVLPHTYIHNKLC